MNGKIYLKKNEEKRLLAGHQWIFSNEIDRKEDIADNVCISSLYDSGGRFLGKGFYNGHSLIAYRHLTSKDEDIDSRFIFKRLSRANSLRMKKNPGRSVYRLFNGEADYLPGLIIDKFGDRYSIQIFSAGMELLKNDIVAVLADNLKAAQIVEKNMIAARKLEGLELSEGCLYRANPEVADEFVSEIDGISYSINLLEGQKSGFYLDQCSNRELVREYAVTDGKFLDLFCNDGGFGLNAAKAGVEDITLVDAGDTRAARNFEINGFRIPAIHKTDCFDFIDGMFQTPLRYDFIVLDPPSFAKNRKSVQPALKAYLELNYKCMKLLKHDSFLFTFSCSHHISETTFEEMLLKASLKSGRRFQLIHKAVCSFDHPVLLQMPETRYLKGYLLRVI